MAICEASLLSRLDSRLDSLQDRSIEGALTTLDTRGVRRPNRFQPIFRRFREELFSNLAEEVLNGCHAISRSAGAVEMSYRSWRRAGL